MIKFWQSLALVVSVLLLSGSASAAVAGTTNVSGAVSQTYSADSSVLPGMAVELKAGTQDTVTALPAKDAGKMLGVVVPVGDATIVLAPQTPASQQVLIANSGRHELLVSNQNGTVKAGDYLSMSALAGIAMKAGVNDGQAVGQAVSGFDGTNDVLGTTLVQGSLGKSVKVAIGRVAVDIRLGQNPQQQKASGGSVPGILNKTAAGVANRPVSSGRIYLGAAVFIATILITASMFYSSVRGGMIAVGRNPLSKHVILRSLFQTVIAGVVVFAIGVFTVYLILKL